MIISFSGTPGSGKSTVAKKLAAALNWPRYYIGGLRREMALKKGMSLEEYNLYGETHPETDLEVDKYQAELGKTQDNFVIEGRTSWHFIPQSIKIFIKVDPLVGAERIFQDLQAGIRPEEGNAQVEIQEIMRSNLARVESDKRRYQEYFQIDAYDEVNYDLVIDTTNLTKEQTLEQVLEYIKTKQIIA